jgi:hypothetical protein
MTKDVSRANAYCKNCRKLLAKYNADPKRPNYLLINTHNNDSDIFICEMSQRKGSYNEVKSFYSNKALFFCNTDCLKKALDKLMIIKTVEQSI